MIHHDPSLHRHAPRLVVALAALVANMLASPAAPVAAPDEAALLPAPDLVAAYPAPARRLIDLAELADRHRDVLRLEALPGTEELRPGPVLATLGLDGGVAPDLRPALLVVGGLDPSHVVGIEAAHRFVADVAARASGPDPLDPGLAEQLRRATIYVVPCLDMAGALAIASSSPRGARLAAAEPHDDDGDALVDEDPADDLDGDGHITAMRIADPAGRWIEDARDPRIMHRARPDRGERGRWRLETEGRDDDGDGRYNEDGGDGTILARHWPLGRDWIDPRAGVYPLRRAEAKALAEFLVVRENIAIVVALGPDDTLASPTKGKAVTSSRRPLDDWDADDAPHLAKIATAWREAIGLDAKAAVTLGAPTRGTLGEFAYHARGRLAFAMGVWSPSLQLALEGAREKERQDGTKSDGEPTPEGATDSSREDGPASADGGAASHPPSGRRWVSDPVEEGATPPEPGSREARFEEHRRIMLERLDQARRERQAVHDAAYQAETGGAPTAADPAADPAADEIEDDAEATDASVEAPAMAPPRRDGGTSARDGRTFTPREETITFDPTDVRHVRAMPDREAGATPDRRIALALNDAPAMTAIMAVQHTIRREVAVFGELPVEKITLLVKDMTPDAVVGVLAGGLGGTWAFNATHDRFEIWMQDEAHHLTDAAGAGSGATPPTATATSPDDAPDDAPDDVKERRKVLAWFDREMPGAVRPWREVPSVARDGARTEVGGLVPFAETAPPPALVDDLLTSQSLFLAGLLDLLPHVDLVDPSARELSPGVYDVTVHVVNRGRLLPTRLAHGRRSDELRPEWVEFDVADDAIVAGRRRTRLEPIAAGDAATVRAVVAAPAGTALRVAVTSAHAGRAEATIVLGGKRDASPQAASEASGSTPAPASTPATEER